MTPPAASAATHPGVPDSAASSPNLRPAATLPDFLARIDRRSARIGIIGLGYVGLPLMLLFSEQGFAVTGLDIDVEKVATLNAGRSYIHRIEPEHIAAAQRQGFRATAAFADVAALDAVLICVPTPLHRDHTPDMSFVVSTIEAIAPHLHPGQLVILESTTYPGTTEEIIVAAIERHGNQVLRNSDKDCHPERSEGPASPTAATTSSATTAPLLSFRSAAEEPASASAFLSSIPSESEEPASQPKISTPDSTPLPGIMVAFSPEREDPGNLTTPRREIPKVIGGVDTRATTAAQALYGSIFTRTVPMSTPAAAEMTKLLENIYRCVNIALVNELKQLCLQMNIDIWEVINAAATKPFGFQPFQPGPGVGGHCIPVDPFYLTWKAKQFGFTTRFIELAGEVNESMPHFVVETTRRALASAKPANSASPMKCHPEHSEGPASALASPTKHSEGPASVLNCHPERSEEPASVLNCHPSRSEGPASPPATAAQAPDPLRNAKILILGVAYKRDVDDLRESPALSVIQLLQAAGAIVSYNDPFFPTVGTGRKYNLRLHSTPLDSDLSLFDCVLILTDHSIYNFPDIVARARLVIDSRDATRHLESPEDRRKIVRC